ncbi:uncharacterized protein STEHIDRAFT_169430 [Stereum hirsutum FP-91666 SS1]|uniref:uncharacterized protein n=1 Tax=Stereum hirsutum (strain FP-91666) TaxID=721885 RepID=UPI000444926A|nr:uncharacterized protein STEHIDRAFT_169430 [Stereum hirsutum FP-91666 SS1]EIM85533.1 hypothetical protein STEHIDRAFT_169430 [Stereum hirsutum FP-91666 SS1]
MPIGTDAPIQPVCLHLRQSVDVTPSRKDPGFPFSPSDGFLHGHALAQSIYSDRLCPARCTTTPVDHVLVFIQTLLPETIFVTSLSASASRTPASLILVLVLVIALVDPTFCAFASTPSAPAVLVRDGIYITTPPSVMLAWCFRPHYRARCGTSPPSGIVLAWLSGSLVDVCSVRWIDVRVRWFIFISIIS